MARDPLHVEVSADRELHGAVLADRLASQIGQGRVRGPRGGYEGVAADADAADGRLVGRRELVLEGAPVARVDQPAGEHEHAAGGQVQPAQRGPVHQVGLVRRGRELEVGAGHDENRRRREQRGEHPVVGPIGCGQRGRGGARALSGGGLGSWRRWGVLEWGELERLALLRLALLRFRLELSVGRYGGSCVRHVAVEVQEGAVVQMGGRELLGRLASPSWGSGRRLARRRALRLELARQRLLGRLP